MQAPKTKGYSELIDKILKEKDTSHQSRKTKLFLFLKNKILVLSVYIITVFFLEEAFDLYEETLLLAIPITILIVFVYNKLANKFNL